MTELLSRSELAGWDLPYLIGRRALGTAPSPRFLIPAALMFAVNMVDVFVLVPAAGGDPTSGNAVGIPASLVVSPVAAALYFFTPGSITEVLRHLAATDGARGNNLGRELERFRRRVSHPLLPAAALLIAALLLGVSMLLLPGGIPQYSLDEMSGRSIFSNVIWGMTYYAGTMTVLRGLAMTYLMARLRLSGGGVEFYVDPHHADGAGGWDALGDYLLGHLLGVLSATIGVSAVLYTGTVEEAWQQLLLAASMPVGAAALIGVPLWLAYTMMRPARRAALAEIRARRRREHEAMRAAITGEDDGVSIASRLEVLQSLDEAERYTRDRYPVVPFRRPALLTLNSLTTISIILATSSTAVALTRTLLAD